MWPHGVSNRNGFGAQTVWDSVVEKLGEATALLAKAVGLAAQGLQSAARLQQPQPVFQDHHSGEIITDARRLRPKATLGCRDPTKRKVQCLALSSRRRKQGSKAKSEASQTGVHELGMATGLNHVDHKRNREARQGEQHRNQNRFRDAFATHLMPPAGSGHVL
jgi:hypothetical protein